MQMDLNSYRGKMGTLIDAGKLLQAIKGGAGSEMRVPNVTVVPGATQEIDLANYFPGDERLVYSVSGANEAIAVCTIKKDTSILVVEGKAVGTTTATIKAGDKEQTIAITVRNSGSEGGWM